VKAHLNLFKEWIGMDAWKHNRREARGKVPAQSRIPVLVHRWRSRD
jgi:hypothetical protein